MALGSSGGGDDDGGGSSGFDPNNAVVVNQSGSASGGFSAGPQDTVVDGSGQIGAGQTVTGIRMTVNYEAYGVPDQFQIVYQGNVIADSGNVSGAGSIQGTAGGTEPRAIVRVITTDGATSWDFSATLEISAQ